MKLIIGNKNYSSWSLRPWLLLSAYEIAFEEIRIPLFAAGYKERILSFSEAGKVPVLHDDNLIIWDSLAICEYICEKYLNGAGWPGDQIKRAKARSVCSEMHSGFSSLRNEMPMNCRARNRKVEITKELQNDISRIEKIWTKFRQENSTSGSWLFGEFSIADCMFAPVVFRFNTYKPELSDKTQEYITTMLEHPKIQLWMKQAQDEQETIAYAEVGD